MRVIFWIDSLNTAISRPPIPDVLSTIPAWFTGGNPSAGIQATFETPEYFNMIQDELLNVVTSAGLTPSKTDSGQLANAITVLAQSTRIRQPLMASLNLYVDAVAGNDTTGLGTNAKPWQTINKAIQTAFDNYDFHGFGLNVNCAPGVYNGSVTIAGTPVGTYGTGGVALVSIVGAGASVCSLAVTGASAFNVINGGLANISGFSISSSSGYGIQAIGSIVNIASITFGSCSAGHIGSFNSASVTAVGPLTFAGSATNGLIALENSKIDATGATLTFSSPIYTTTMLASMVSLIILKSTAITGSATGQKYEIDLGSVLNTNGQPTSFIPGTSNGVSTTGYYN